MARRHPRTLRAPTIAGVPLRATEWFLGIAVVFGVLAGLDVADARLVIVPEINSLEDGMRAFEPGSVLWNPPEVPASWAVLAGLGVALAYALSILAHELAHLAAARACGVDVSAVTLEFWGGFVEIDDDERLTAGRLALIAGAGPLVTALVLLSLAAALTAAGWPLVGATAADTGAEVALGRVLSGAFLLNAVALAINLLPVRPLDGGHLLAALRLRGARGRR